jgi:hypothetical protein
MLKGNLSELLSKERIVSQPSEKRNHFAHLKHCGAKSLVVKKGAQLSGINT